eukprot:COSAG01_NODE_31247_length_601_cov_0.725100_1_plen_98_part_10
MAILTPFVVVHTKTAEFATLRGAFSGHASVPARWPPCPKQSVTLLFGQYATSDASATLFEHHCSAAGASVFRLQIGVISGWRSQSVKIDYRPVLFWHT